MQYLLSQSKEINVEPHAFRRFNTVRFQFIHSSAVSDQYSVLTDTGPISDIKWYTDCRYWYQDWKSWITASLSAPRASDWTQSWLKKLPFIVTQMNLTSIQKSAQTKARTFSCLRLNPTIAGTKVTKIQWFVVYVLYPGNSFVWHFLHPSTWWNLIVFN